MEQEQDDPKWVENLQWPDGIELTQADDDNIMFLLAHKISQFLFDELKNKDYEISHTGHQIGIKVPISGSGKKIAKHLPIFINVESVHVLD